MESEPPHRGDARSLPSGGKFELARTGEPTGRSLGRSPLEEELEGLDVRRLLHVLWRRKWWILAAGALGIAAGVLLYRQSTPVYQTHSSVWVESGDDSQGPIQGEEVFQGQGWSDLFTSLAVLEPVARDLDLYLDASTRRSPLADSLEVTEDVRAGRYRLTVDSAGQYALRYGENRIVDRGQVGDSIGTEVGLRWSPGPDALSPGTEMSFTVQTPAGAASKIQRSLRVAYNPRSGSLITARLRWDDPQEAARILNRTVQSFLAVAHDLKTQKLQETVRILERQTQVAEERLTEAELAYENARVENVTLPGQPNAAPMPSGQTQGRRTRTSMDPYFQAYFQKRLRSDQLRSDLERLRAVLEARSRGDSLDLLELRSISAVGQSPELQASLDQLSQLKAERRSLLLTYTEEHPRVREVSEEIRALTDRTIPAQIRKLAESLRSELDRIESDVKRQQAELRDIPPRLIEEERLRRQMQQAERLHSDLLSRLKSAELALATTRPNLQVVDRAHPPGAPTSNQGPRFLLMASLAGFGLGIGGVVLHDRLDDRVREPDDVEGALGLPVLGLIPRIPASTEGDDVPPGVLESFRSIRAQLNRSVDSGPLSLVVTSPEPRDGKSLVAANLAISFASARRSTLLVDGDLRRGNTHQLFDLPPEPGLADCLNGSVELSEIIRTTEVPGLLLITRGDVRGFDPDRLEGPELGSLFEAVRRRFDAVICDSPPLGAGTDALLFGEECQQALLVLRTGATDKEVTRARLEASMYFDFPLVGAVLNDVPDSAPYYRYYSPYQYYLEAGEMVS